MLYPDKFSGIDTCHLKQQGNESLIVVDRPESSATISLRGGQILSYQAQGQHPLLWHNDNAAYQADSPIRQGAPVCWPWFGDLYKNPDAVQSQFSQQYGHDESAPQHGLVRGKEWKLQGITEHAEATEVVLTTELTNAGAHNVSLLANYRVGSELNIELITENRAKESFNFSCALHSYFAVSDIDNIVISGLHETSYYDTLKDWKLCQQQGDIVVTKEVDRVYVNTPSLIRIKDKAWQREIILESAESRSTVVWNPWVEKARRLSQFDSECFRTMICIETAKVLNDFVRVLPGQCHRLPLKLSAKSLAIQTRKSG